MVLCSTSNLTWSKDVTAVNIMQISKKASKFKRNKLYKAFQVTVEQEKSEEKLFSHI